MKIFLKAETTQKEEIKEIIDYAHELEDEHRKSGRIPNEIQLEILHRTKKLDRKSIYHSTKTLLSTTRDMHEEVQDNKFD